MAGAVHAHQRSRPHKKLRLPEWYVTLAREPGLTGAPYRKAQQVATRQCATATVNAVNDKAARDTAIEGVDIPATFVTCEDIVAPGGTIANVGVHGVKVHLHLEACGRGTSPSLPPC
jgi:threonine dehydrogenase-like Zn-dependent dehydrogenase